MGDFAISQPYSDRPLAIAREDFNDEFSEGGSSTSTFPTQAGLPPHSSAMKKPRTRSRVWILLGALLGVVIVGAIMGSLLDGNERGPTVSAMAYLEYMKVTSADAFSDSKSPQSKAIEWMIHKDPMKLGISDAGFVQRYVIATLVHAVVVSSENESLLRDELGFLSEKHECDWQAEWKNTQDDSDILLGIHCNDDHAVTQIIMPALGLKGSLPQDLRALEHLEKIVLDANQLGGSIPYVPSLKSLSLAYNRMEGTLPEYLSLMTSLEELILAENLFDGRLPEEVDSLTNLKHLAINGNELTGGIHSIFHLTELEEVYGGFNSLKDGFDNDSFGRLTNLRVLDLKNNKLKGPFPDALWTLPKLQVVDFHFNALDGHLHEIKDRHSPVLEYLDVSENFLSGGMPTTLNRVSSLVHLDVSSNRFEKPLPEDYNGLTSMKTLLLSDNGMFGPQSIPTWINRMTDLRHLSLKLTSRTGTIPDWFATNLKKLETLDLDWNRISGSIPNDFAHLTNLQHLILNRNWFEGIIPSSISTLPYLNTVMVDNNRLVGELVACQASLVIADCGDPKDGCPNCVSQTMEVNCPCCTRCCYDGDELCNTQNWLSQILEDKRTADPMIFYPSNYRPTDYTPENVFRPKDDASP